MGGLAEISFFSTFSKAIETSMSFSFEVLHLMNGLLNADEELFLGQNVSFRDFYRNLPVIFGLCVCQSSEWPEERIF